MHVRNPILSCLILFAVCFSFASVAARAQDDDVILAPGSPPLTKLMAGKVVVTLKWALDVELTRSQEEKIGNALIRSWRANDVADIQGALEIVETYDRISKLSEAERNRARPKLKEAVLQGLRANPDDELSRILLSAYGGASSSEQFTGPPPVAAGNGQRVGADGFSGLYRLVRPKMGGVGVVIEYITFFPDGTVFWRFPAEGLRYFEAAAARGHHPNDWGTYQIKNGDIHIQRGPDRTNYVMTRQGERLNNPPSLGKGTFRPVPPADNLRLEGRYRRVGNAQSPAVMFTRDGKFRDEGAFRYSSYTRLNGTNYSDDGAAGTGTYSIGQNTLELNYSDGRVKRFTFVTFPENLAKKPAVDSFIINYNDSFQID